MNQVTDQRDSTRDQQGVVIFNRDRRILFITPGAEVMLGWASSDVAGAHCHSVFDCRGADGRSLCDECGLADIFDQHGVIESPDLRIQSAMADRVAVRASFWYLPPTDRIREPRAMAVLRRER